MEESRRFRLVRETRDGEAQKIMTLVLVRVRAGGAAGPATETSRDRDVTGRKIAAGRVAGAAVAVPWRRAPPAALDPASGAP